MAKNENRFMVVHREGSDFKETGSCMILVDRETGVAYLTWKSGYGAGLTPLLGPDGKPIIYRFQ
ncbi:MAG: DUF6440 family protein [Ruminiclostridium sp.]|nr:DUF6440 family protein [Ruminiclostridium sp.]